MTLIEKRLLVPQESYELVEALALVLEDAIDGAKVNAVINNLPALLKAVQGIDKLPSEIKSKHRDDLSAFLVKRMMEALDKGSRGDEPVSPNDL